jgi:HSP20 family molecular chaperone IbpA
MSDTSKESLSDAQRRILLERTFGSPGQVAAYWSTFANEFFKGISQSFLPSRQGFPSLYSLQQFTAPGVDLIEEGNDLVVTVEMPGFSSEEIHARILDNVLYVSAKRGKGGKEMEAEKVYFTSRQSTFNRTIWLPIPVEDTGKIKGKYADGILRIKIPIRATSTITIE